MSNFLYVIAKNFNGQLSLPLSSLQVFHASCPKRKSELSIVLNDAMKSEIQKNNGLSGVSFSEGSISNCPLHQRHYAERSFGYPEPVQPKLMPSWKTLGVSPTVYLLHSLARMFTALLFMSLSYASRYRN
jgi:hypothetical protein